MPISLGNLVVEGAYLGSIPADKVMLGNEEIWSPVSYPIEGSWSVAIPELGSVVVGEHFFKKRGLFRISVNAEFSVKEFRTLALSLPSGSISTSSGFDYEGTVPGYSYLQTTQALSREQEFRVQVGTLSPSTSQGTWYVEELGPYTLVNSSPDHWFPLRFTDLPYRNRGVKTTELAFHTETRFADRGQHAYIDRGSKSRLDLQETWEGSWSMAGWFQRTGAATVDGDVLFARGNPTVGREVRLYADPNGVDLRLHINSGSSTSTTALIPGALPTSVWKHIAITSELTGGRPHILVYLDGVAVYETYVANNFPFSLTDWVSFGNYADNTLSSPFNGNLDDPALWSRTLSSNEVFQIFQNGRIPT